jgi:FAD/FMN-containing dehydrogenase
MYEDIKSKISGEILTDDTTLTKYSHDASLLEVRPRVVIHPKDANDIKAVVKYVADHKQSDATLSVTARAAGSCMAGGSLNESIILDITTHMQGILGFEGESARILPGTFYRDFEKETLTRNLLLPCFTASKNLNTLGGMIGNNSAGEKTLRYGKMENFVDETKVVFADGNEYLVKPLSRLNLDKKIAQGDYEGNIYKGIWELIEKNKEVITAGKPQVSKNSAGYYIWNVWNNGSRGESSGSPLEVSPWEPTFDLNKLLVGSQGTLGIVTEAKIRLVPVRNETKLFVIFLPDITRISEIVNIILPLDPESVEDYDDATMKLAVKFFPEMVKTMKAGFLKMMWEFIPEAEMILTGGIPKFVLLVEFTETTMEEVDRKISSLDEQMKQFGLKTHIVESKDEAEKYWTIRRESFNLLRKHVKDRRTAPFIDDVIVDPKYMPEFLPKMRAILDSYKMTYTINGHAGNGNFHVIPLMDMHDPKSIETIMEVGEEVYDLIAEYHGSITAEHNDGIVRTPYLYKMYSPEILDIFQQIKTIFDPHNIFNPGKKVNGTLQYFKSHIAKE